MTESKKESSALLGDMPVLEAGEAGRQDLLNFSSMAKVLANAAVATPNPLTIGIFGEWGSGKTSLMRLIKAIVEKEHSQKTAAVWFNAWQYEKEEHLIVPLVATINKELEKRTWPEKLKQRAKEIREALRAFIYGISVKGKVGIPFIGEVEAGLSTKDMVARSRELTQDTVLARSLYFDAFERFEALTKKRGTPRIVVFVDDLDRCFPQIALELLEHIKLVLHQPGFCFILGVNEKIIQAVVKNKFAKEYPSVDKDYTEDYLHKITQVHVYVPQRETLDMKMYIKKLLDEIRYDLDEIGDDLDDDDPDKKTMENAISSIAEAGKHNPRSIIRFINHIMVTKRIGKLEGKPYKFSALIIAEAMSGPRYQRFIKSLDLKPPEHDKTIGAILADILKEYTGEFDELSTNLADKIKPFNSRSLESMISTLQEKENIFNLMNSEVGRKWLGDSEYRRTVGEARKRTIGEGKSESVEKEEEGGRSDQIAGLLRDLVPIPKGKFNMGGELEPDEQPIHEVNLESFEIGAVPVTQAQYQAIMGENPSLFKGLDHPVEKVSWNDAMEFCEKLSAMTKRQFKLPSEAQWEYACRAGSTTKYCFGDDETQLGDYAWYNGNSNGTTHPVRQKKPNAWGLCDMYGNVWELCMDHWHGNYEGAFSDGRAWVEKDTPMLSRMFRGGALNNTPEYCRSSNRNHHTPDFRADNLGFRVLAVPVDGK